MKIDAYSILIVLSILVVLSYFFNFLSEKSRIPSVLLLIGCGIGLKYAGEYLAIQLPFTKTLLEMLGITGLIFIVLEAALDLRLERRKFPLIMRAFLSALILLGGTALLISGVFVYAYHTSFHLALLHALPLSVISSAIAIPSVKNMDEDKKEFIVYESTFSDILGIIAFNVIVSDHSSGITAVLSFGWDLILIMIVSVISTTALLWLLSRTTSHVRFFLTFAVIILVYSLAKFLHLPSLILVLCFGLVLGNFYMLPYPLAKKFLSFDRLRDVNKELKLMTAETAFIIRTFFFLLFGYSLDMALLQSWNVLALGVIIIVITLAIRYAFLKWLIKTNVAPLSLIAPRGLITILLFYSIPETQRLHDLSEGVLFIVIVFTGIAMTLGLILNSSRQSEKSDHEA